MASRTARPGHSRKRVARIDKGKRPQRRRKSSSPPNAALQPSQFPLHLSSGDFVGDLFVSTKGLQSALAKLVGASALDKAIGQDVAVLLEAIPSDAAEHLEAYLDFSVTTSLWFFMSARGALRPELRGGILDEQLAQFQQLESRLESISSDWLPVLNSTPSVRLLRQEQRRHDRLLV